jgi:hypothetical protein
MRLTPDQIRQVRRLSGSAGGELTVRFVGRAGPSAGIEAQLIFTETARVWHSAVSSNEARALEAAIRTAPRTKEKQS